MIKIKPIIVTDGKITIHPIRNSDLNKEKIEQIIEDMYSIYSNNETVKYIPDKKLNSFKEAIDRFQKIRLNYGLQTSFTHFITINSIGRIAGEINIISPLGASSYKIPNYELKDVWFIEYAKNIGLGKFGIITRSLKVIIKDLNEQGISKFGAVCFRENKESIKVLLNLGFNKITQFDIYQDYYELRV